MQLVSLVVTTIVTSSIVALLDIILISLRTRSLSQDLQQLPTRNIRIAILGAVLWGGSLTIIDYQRFGTLSLYGLFCGIVWFIITYSVLQTRSFMVRQ